MAETPITRVMGDGLEPPACTDCGAEFGYGPGQVRRLQTFGQEGSWESWCSPCIHAREDRYRSKLAGRG